jgi:hypothetical protein
MVIDGQVVGSGPTLRSYPPKEDILKLCRRTGKWPFVFVHEAATAIEESASAWGVNCFTSCSHTYTWILLDVRRRLICPERWLGFERLGTSRFTDAQT